MGKLFFKSQELKKGIDPKTPDRFSSVFLKLDYDPKRV